MIDDKKVNKKLIASSILFVVITILLTIYRSFFMQSPLIKTPDSKEKITEEEVLCAQDVQICPDGSFVSRIAPSCEFAECPVSEDSTTSAEFQQESLE